MAVYQDSSVKLLHEDTPISNIKRSINVIMCSPPLVTFNVVP